MGKKFQYRLEQNLTKFMIIIVLITIVSFPTMAFLSDEKIKNVFFSKVLSSYYYLNNDLSMYYIASNCTIEYCPYFYNGEANIVFSTFREFDLLDDFESLNAIADTVVIHPSFTQSAYSSGGFYDYYLEKCNIDCLTVDINYDMVCGNSGNGFRVLKFLGYRHLTDIEIDKDHQMLAEYDKVIILHNEYVTKKEYDAIINHPNVIFLYPNALYAEISANYNDETITLIRGHSYPDGVSNGFSWKYDNTPEEWNDCNNWNFYQIENGYMLNCYPEKDVVYDKTLLKKLKEI